MKQSTHIVLISKFLSGNATPEEIATLQTWRAADANYEREFRAAERLWDSTLALRKEKTHDAGPAWDDFLNRVEKRKSAGSKTWILRAAASLLLIIGLSLLLKYLLPGTPEKKLSVSHTSSLPSARPLSQPLNHQPADSANGAVIAQNTPKKNLPVTNLISTGDSAMVFLLPDSTRVYLNSHSSISYQAGFGKKERRLKLSGEAFFEVNHLPTPFFVACGKTVVHDIGTSFNVKGVAADSAVEVSVFTGSVEFYRQGAPASQTLLLKEGSSGIYNARQATLVKAKIKKGKKWWKAKGLKNKLREFFDKLKGNKR